MQAERFVCRLRPEDVDRRRRQGHILKSGLISGGRAQDRVELTFPADLKPNVEEFVREESECCPFFGFELHDGDDSVSLTVTAPREAGHMLDELLAEFQKGDC